MGKIKIEVYGGVNMDSGSGILDCGGCTPSSVGRREFEIMKEVLVESFGEESLSLAYIDTRAVEQSAFPEVEKALQAGSAFPITFVNGILRWAGTMPLDSIAKIVQAQLQGKTS